ncbi:hypothetical protein MKK70_21375 [Methylobacterium sp. E-041]|uniref:hypothetical protein n=1 Tax=Methylobacterium sp. E-041 TaxID=2836573 RepID=UPI001FBB2751|nr:hypothetical protein [Methylobacterium sp. E-041]MCJ2107880.1 hypothetical protein [Methylobacterium sp. E-041]
MSNPLSKLVAFFRIQMSGAPVEHLENAVSSIEEHVAAEIEAALKPIRDDVATMRAEFEALKSGAVAAVAPASTDLTDTLDALHRRLEAVEQAAKAPAATTGTTPPRAAAPAARPAA